MTSSHPEAPDIPGLRLVREVGRGGVGVVWLAEQEHLHRQVAVKLLPGARDDEEGVLREARLAARLQHRNIVPVYSAGTHEGRHYFLMEYVEGCTLNQVIAALRLMTERDSEPMAALPEPILRHLIRSGSAPLPTSEEMRSLAFKLHRVAVTTLVEDLHEVALAIEHAHHNEVVHGDLKPSNLIYDSQGILRVLDFGMARTTSAEDAASGEPAGGTPRYMSPERLLHAGPSPPTVAGDVYALGATLYECVTLQPIYPGESRAQIVAQVATGNPAPPRQLNTRIHRDLEAIILQAIQRQPGDRYPTPADLAHDLQRFLNHEPARATSGLTRALLGLRHTSLTRVLTLSAALVISAGAAFLFVRQELRQRREEQSIRALCDGAFTLLASTNDKLEESGQGANQVEVAQALEQGRQQLLDALSRAQHRPELEAEVRVMLTRHRHDSLLARARLHALAGQREKVRRLIDSASQIAPVDVARTLAQTGLLSTITIDLVTPPIAEVEVLLHEIDPQTGKASPLPLARGAPPFESPPVVASGVLITLSSAGGRAVQFPLQLEAGSRVEIRVPLEPDKVPASMEYIAAFSGQQVTVGDMATTQADGAVGPRTFVLRRALFVDRCEVTNQEFFTFFSRRDYVDRIVDVLETWFPDMEIEDPSLMRTILPEGWWGEQPPVGTEEHPARVQWYQALAYAKHRGAFLLDEHEWEYMARGVDERPYPSGYRFDREHISPHPIPVGSRPSDRSPFGVLDLLGSVREFTWQAGGQRLCVRGSTRNTVSSYWARSAARHATRTSSPYGSTTEDTASVESLRQNTGLGSRFGLYRSLAHGIRCATAAEPLEVSVTRTTKP